MTRFSVYFSFPILLGLAILQTAVLSHFPILGYVPQVPLLVALAWAMLRGENEGAVWLFVAGFCMDLYSVAPLGVSSLILLPIMLLIGFIQRSLPTNRFLLPMILTFIASILFLSAHTLLVQLLQMSVNVGQIVTLFPLALLYALLIVPIYWLAYLIEGIINPRRVEI